MASRPGSSKNMIYGIFVMIASIVSIVVFGILGTTFGNILWFSLFGIGAALGLLSLRDPNKAKGGTVLAVSLGAIALGLFWPGVFSFLTAASVVGLVVGGGMTYFGYREWKALPGSRD